MIANPKPSPRAPKAPKRIARKRVKPRTVKNRCVDPAHPRCKRAPLHLGRCGTHADEYLLALRRSLVVKATCELGDWHLMTNTHCSEDPQDNHSIDRGYRRGNLRWVGPGFSGCSGANAAAHYRRLEWQEFLKIKFGKEEYERLVDIALNGPKADYAEAERELLARLTGQSHANEVGNGR